MPEPRDPNKFWNAVAVFAFEGYLKHGPGCVQVKEPDEGAEKITEVMFDYFPASSKIERLPDEAHEMMSEYDPATDVIFVIADHRDHNLVLRLVAESGQKTPMELYREKAIEAKRGQWIAGEVLYLEAAIGDVQPDHYVFLRSEGASMILCHAEVDPENNHTSRTDDIVTVHRDYELMFRSIAGMVVP